MVFKTAKDDQFPEERYSVKINLKSNTRINERTRAGTGPESGIDTSELMVSLVAPGSSEPKRGGRRTGPTRGRRTPVVAVSILRLWMPGITDKLAEHRLTAKTGHVRSSWQPADTDDDDGNLPPLSPPSPGFPRHTLSNPKSLETCDKEWRRRARCRSNSEKRMTVVADTGSTLSSTGTQR